MSNLLRNASFELGSSPTTLIGKQISAWSAATDWHVQNNLQADTSFEPTTTTELIPSTCPSGGTNMIHVKTNGNRNGIGQNFVLEINTGPITSIASAWIYVTNGKVGIGTGNQGNTHLDAFSSKINTWEFLESTNGVSPANSFIVHSVTSEAEFYVDNATVEVLELTGTWQGDDGGVYYLRQLKEQLWWYGEKSATNPDWSHVFQGTIKDSKIDGKWINVPKGSILQNGDLVVQIVSANRLRAISKTEGFQGIEWTRI
jgi:hypothetical protein